VVAVAEVAIEVAEAGDPQQDGRSTEFSWQVITNTAAS
jgi:hypothetical protein